MAADGDQWRMALGGNKGIYFGLFIIANIPFPYKCWILIGGGNIFEVIFPPKNAIFSRMLLQISYQTFM